MLRLGAVLLGGVSLAATAPLLASGAVLPCLGPVEAVPGSCEAWVVTHDSGSDRDDEAHALVVDAANRRVFLANERVPLAGGGYDGQVAAFDLDTGAPIWSRVLSAAAVRTLAISADGATLFAAGDRYLETWALDAVTGATRWYAIHVDTNAYQSDGSGEHLALAGGRVFLSGMFWGGETGHDAGLLALDASTGARAWSSTYSTSRQETPHSIAVSPDGSRVFLLVGPTRRSVTSPLDARVVTLAFDASTGATIWTRSDPLAPSSRDVPGGLAVAPDGSRVFVLAVSRPTIETARWVTTAYDAATGATAWSTLGPAGLGGADGAGLVATADRVVFAASLALVPSSVSSATLAVTGALDPATGAPLWATAHAGPGRGSVARAVALADDRVIVAAESREPNSRSQVDTLAYDLTAGTLAMLRSYGEDLERYDRPVALAASADRVVVAARTDPLSGDVDAPVLAYDLPA